MSDNGHKQYTADDFSRYHSGTMSEREMYDLERAALQDPFLADALEGYAFTTTPKEDIEELREKLNKEDNRKRFISFPFLRVAAMIVIIAGAGILFYVFNRKGDVIQPTARTITREAPIGVSSDSSTAAPAKDEDRDNSAATKEGTSTLHGNGLMNKKQANNENNGSEGRADITQLALNNKDEKKEKRKATDLVVRIDTTRLVSGEAQSDVTLSKPSQEKDKAAAPVLEERSYAIKAPESTDSFGVASAQTMRKKAPASAVESSASISFVLAGKVAGVNVQRATNPAVTHVRLRQDTLAEPIGGWEQFNTYLQQQVTSSLATNAYHGDVTLSFLLNDNGKPRRVRIEHSSCEVCEQAARRILSEGPPWNWKTGKKGRATVTIAF